MWEVPLGKGSLDRVLCIYESVGLEGHSQRIAFMIRWRKSRYDHLRAETP